MALTVPAPASLNDRPLAEAAIAWADAGWHVFPIVPRGKTPYGAGEFCERSEDHACGFHCASTDQAQLAGWWDEHPDSNVGITDPSSANVDEDRIGVLAEKGIHLPRCPWEVTGRQGGGRHFFLTAPTDWPGLRGDEVKVNYRVAGIEVKGFDKGYLVAAPSIHATGNRYELKAGGYVPECPRGVLDELVEVVSRGRPPALITVADGAYELPPHGYDGQRYKAILTYTAHLYNREFTTEEMWGLVLTRLAPRFARPLSERELRERFDRATKDIAKSLGERRGHATTAASGPIVDQALTEFDSRPIGWLWESWLPRGVVTLMDGNPGVSKSTLVADLVARITTGRDWPDGSAASGQPGRVIWITTEDDPGRVLRPRIEAAGGEASLVRFVTSEVVFPSSATAFREFLVQRASEPLGLAFVVLDPLFSHIDAKVRSIADAEMRQNVMNPLGDAAEAADVSILVVRHFNKDTAASALNRGAGSLGGIVGAARALWSVTVDPEDESGETKAVGVTKLNYARIPMPLRYRVVDRLPPGWIKGSVAGIEWLGSAPVSIDTMMREQGDIRDAVSALTEILAPGPVGATAAYARMRSKGFGRDATKGAKQRLHVVSTKTGMTGGWEWSLPDAPEGADEGAGSAPSAPSASSDEKERDSCIPFDATSSAPSASSKERKERVAGGPPHMRAREGAWVAPCLDYARHQSAHYRSPEGFVCPVCYPEAETA